VKSVIMRLIIVTLIVISMEQTQHVDAAPTKYPETPYPLCDVGGYAQVDVTDSISMSLFDGYALQISQLNPGLTQDGVSLPVFPIHTITGSASPIINGVGGTPIALYYCYYITGTPTPTSGPTPDPSVCAPGGDIISLTLYDVVSTTTWGSDVPTLTFDASSYGQIQVSISDPHPSNYFRWYSTLPSPYNSLWSEIGGWPAAPQPAISPWPDADHPIIIDSPGMFAFRSAVNGTDYGGIDHITTVPGLITVCVVGLFPTPSPTAIATNTPQRPEPNLSPTNTRTPLPTRTIGPPTATRTPTRSPYPTAVNQCSQIRLAPGGITTEQIDSGAFIRTLNGIAVVAGSISNYSVGTSGMTWKESSGTYTIGAISISDGGSQLVIEICQIGQNWTPTMTITPTAPALPCAVASSVGVPVAPGTATLSFSVGMQFVVAGASVWVNIGDSAYEIRVGNYRWDLDTGDYTAYSLTAPATVWICATTIATYTPTSGTAFPTPGPGGIATAACVPLSPTATTISYAMPQLGFVIPARATRTPTITSTNQLSATAIIAFQQTISAGLASPAAGVATLSAGYSWQSGQILGVTAVAVAQPGLVWLALINPINPAWDATGGPLWAIAPVFRPIMPILASLMLVAIGRFILWIVDWFIKLVGLIIQAIKLLPFL
jgi:hypothetical protein